MPAARPEQPPPTNLKVFQAMQTSKEEHREEQKPPGLHPCKGCSALLLLSPFIHGLHAAEGIPEVFSISWGVGELKPQEMRHSYVFANPETTSTLGTQEEKEKTKKKPNKTHKTAAPASLQRAPSTFHCSLTEAAEHKDRRLRGLGLRQPISSAWPSSGHKSC